MSTEGQESDAKPRKPRGFAAMSPEKQKELSRKGGEAAHAKGVAHRFTPADARTAGSKGGRTTHARRRAARAEGAES